ncbi:HsdM family class I SAM-dependent methyltransferase [Thalassoglobus polymorphus]|uniref:site-specific DNA-methyltransferase (adenine-specific) n=1 Tax=Thalassoglobus polymorphus TaxID=2527994 RepID=A0A517QKA5_9PLAN|nr:class I SAM-dependent DNA methyltransferase [Thalassoglobus polymorphus]QDT32061.1 Type I restriction enzyme EcoKI M protein [Thalassoglobus polymorphus]
MAIKKSELYSSIWASCDELRGGMDASQYKDYVLFMLFIKYVSDKYGDSDDFAPPVTIPPGASFKDMVALKGKSDIGGKINTQIIQPLIDNNTRLARSDFPDFNDPNKLGEGQAMVDRLTNLVSIFQKPELNFSKNRAENDDILGDAYEYLMRHFASQSGKSKGQFYTPSEVSRIMAKVIGISSKNAVASTTAYDPTCGSGSLLLKVAAEANVHITLEGQEKDVTTAGLARMNMILHDFPTANILAGNTLASPKFKDGERLRTYDYVVANPPFSDKTWSTGLTPANDPYQRFAWGEPPGKQGDYAYLLHIIRSLKKEGKGACILPHGVLFRGNAEATIRKQLVDSGYLKGIIGLPANLFYGTGIPACILVLDKENATARKGIFMIDASKGFIKDGNKNRLREQDIHRIVDTFTRQDESDPRYARMVKTAEISDPKNDYNLNLPRYIDSSEPEDIQDIDGHLRGGIPVCDIDDLDRYWQVIPGVRSSLLKKADRPGYFNLRLPIGEVKQAIFDHEEFTAFIKSTTKLFTRWKKDNAPLLTGFDKEDHPKQLIETIAEDLLARFQKAPLLDAYDIYQHLMDYWAETMQDDCYLIAADGWVAKTHRVIEEVKSGKKKGEKKDKGWACDLIPKPLIVARYFAKEQQAIDALETELASVAAELEELSEEHGGEEGVLKDVSSKSDAEEAYTQAIIPIWNDENKKTCGEYNTLVESADGCAARLKELSDHHYLSALKTSKGKLTLKAVKTRREKLDAGDEAKTLTEYIDTDKQQKADAKQAKVLFADAETSIVARLSEDPLPENYSDLQVVVRYLELLASQSELKSKLKAAVEELDKLAHDKYPQLSVEEIKSIVVDDKWLSTLSASVQGELDRVSQRLTSRIRQLAERYVTPLPELTIELATLSGRVDGHLKKMGAVWN